MGAAWCLSCNPWKMGLGRGDAERTVDSIPGGFIPNEAGGGGGGGGSPLPAPDEAGSYVVAPPGGIEACEAPGAATVACRWSDAVVRG
jgi:hypothetical protein